MLVGNDARTLTHAILTMDVDAHRAAFRGSTLERVKPPMLKRNAAVVLGDVGTPEDVDVLTRAADDGEPLVREHAWWSRRSTGRERCADGSPPE